MLPNDNEPGEESSYLHATNTDSKGCWCALFTLLYLTCFLLFWCIITMLPGSHLQIQNTWIFILGYHIFKQQKFWMYKLRALVFPVGRTCSCPRTLHILFTSSLDYSLISIPAHLSWWSSYYLKFHCFLRADCPFKILPDGPFLLQRVLRVHKVQWEFELYITSWSVDQFPWVLGFRAERRNSTIFNVTGLSLWDFKIRM